jgi:hypothetical protein
LLCVQSELSIGVPAAHYKHEIQDRAVVWLRKKAIEDWEGTLVRSR